MGEGRRKAEPARLEAGRAWTGRLLFWRVGCLFGIVAVVLATACFLSYRENRRLQVLADHAMGRVVEMRRDGDSTYRPVVSFRTAQGQTVTFATSWATNPPAYRVGDPVSVIYDAAAPEQARIDGFFPFWASTLILAFVAAVFGLLSAILMIVAKRG
ncbi:DUF3592 domain-containing protein [Bosea sp. (in: a-proteobacteria)]